MENVAVFPSVHGFPALASKGALSWGEGQRGENSPQYFYTKEFFFFLTTELRGTNQKFGMRMGERCVCILTV